MRIAKLYDINGKEIKVPEQANPEDHGVVMGEDAFVYIPCVDLFNYDDKKLTEFIKKVTPRAYRLLNYDGISFECGKPQILNDTWVINLRDK